MNETTFTGDMGQFRKSDFKDAIEDLAEDEEEQPLGELEDVEEEGLDVGPPTLERHVSLKPPSRSLPTID